MVVECDFRGVVKKVRCRSALALCAVDVVESGVVRAIVKMWLSSVLRKA